MLRREAHHYQSGLAIPSDAVAACWPTAADASLLRPRQPELLCFSTQTITAQLYPPHAPSQIVDKTPPPPRSPRSSASVSLSPAAAPFDPGRGACACSARVPPCPMGPVGLWAGGTSVTRKQGRRLPRRRLEVTALPSPAWATGRGRRVFLGGGRSVKTPRRARAGNPEGAGGTCVSPSSVPLRHTALRCACPALPCAAPLFPPSPAGLGLGG
ncbi:hypothetical protein BS78_01G471600 [Paspalum vaginatum]|nr:hypothetical protein BS78_01G471600 [Paspalum vaginatum]